MERCFYKNSINEFLNADENYIFGLIDKQAHGVIHTTSRDAWEAEISIMKNVLHNYSDKEGQIMHLILEWELVEMQCIR